MKAEILLQLKTGSIKNVVIFDSELPKPPYVVIKPETHPSGLGIRIIAHYKKGTTTLMHGGVIYTPLDDYIYTEVHNLLSEFDFTNNHGEHMTVKDTGEITELTPVSDDNTVSMERLFYIPLLNI